MAFMVPIVEWLTEGEAIEFGVGDRPGYYGRLSAPGYMGCTDWSGPFYSQEECLVEVCDQWEVDTDGNSEGDDDYDPAELDEIRAKLNNGKRR